MEKAKSYLIGGIGPSILIFLFMSCATTYQPYSTTGGYSETKLNERVYDVIFAGNGYTSSEDVKNFALYRCAELTVKNGFDYFKFISRSTNATVMNVQTTQTYGNVFPNYYGGYSYSANSNTYNIPITAHSSSVTIIMLKEPEKDIESIDAREILNTIKIRD
jgi:hypothetical protein